MRVFNTGHVCSRRFKQVGHLCSDWKFKVLALIVN